MFSYNIRIDFPLRLPPALFSRIVFINMNESNPEKNLTQIRHSLSHLLAAAMLEKYPGAKLGIGPVIEDGFYYDFLLPDKISDSDFPALEKRIRELIKSNLKFTVKKVTPAAAKKLFRNQPFKLKLVDELKKSRQSITVYETGNIFTDLCAGPHVKNTRAIPLEGFKLWKVAGAYWRGDEKREMLTRVYGLAFSSKKELVEKINQAYEAAKRDHRELGKKLGLFIFSDLVGPGLPLYTPKGALLRKLIADYSRRLREEMGYQEVHTPQINKSELFKRSGHYDKYRDSMFRVSSNYTDEEYFLKPMNCPQHTQLYAASTRSYQDLPIRFSDFANLYRDEKPGELSGLTRLRAFSQDDGHCFCRPDQIAEEFGQLLSAITKSMSAYGLTYTLRLSLRDEKQKNKYLGSDAIWRESQKTLESLLKKRGLKYVRAEGEAAFYGPKLDLIARDALGRDWQLSTIQLDFNMPVRLDLSYVDASGKKLTPVMIHSALIGSPERFMGMLIEHYAGAFPFWLAPIQVRLLSISDKNISYAKTVAAALSTAGVRYELDASASTIGKKIRNAELEKIPYLLIVGAAEAENKTVSVRRSGHGDEGSMPLSRFLKKISSETSR